LKRLGDVADERDQYSESLDFYTKGLAAAEASGNERLAIQTAARLAVCIGDRLNRPRDAGSWIGLARGKLDHYGTDEALEWEVLKAELIVIGDNDQLEESLATYPRLIALSERVFGAAHPRTAQVLANYGYDLADSGHYDLSIAQYVRAISILEKAWGERHPNLALFYTNYAHFLARGGHTDDGFKDYEHALDLNSQFGENRMTSEILGKIATLSVRRRDWARAEQATKRGVPIAENIGKDAEPDLARLLVTKGYMILGRHGDAKEVNELCTRALPLLEPLDGSGNFRADVLRCLGEAALAMGDPDAAIALLERDEKLPRHEWPGDLALERFALARALTAAHKDPARALALATSARDDLRPITQLDADLADVEQWLATRR
jgi:tetratricopeptide (TPR) repeat protein